MTRGSGRRLLAHGALGLLFAALIPGTALACSVCFGPEEGGAAAGLNAGIAVLLALVLLVQGLIVRFFVRAIRRGRKSTSGQRPGTSVEVSS